MSQQKKVFRVTNTPFKDFFFEDPKGVKLREQLFEEEKKQFKEKVAPIAEMLAIRMSKDKRNLDTKKCLYIKIYNNTAHVTLQYVQGGIGTVPVPMELVRAEMEEGLAASTAI